MEEDLQREDVTKKLCAAKKKEMIKRNIAADKKAKQRNLNYSSGITVAR